MFRTRTTHRFEGTYCSAQNNHTLVIHFKTMHPQTCMAKRFVSINKILKVIKTKRRESMKKILGCHHLL
jgi:hypothetical protein